MTQPTTTSTASKIKRPQEGRNIEFPRYVKAILVACAITISLNFTIVNPFVYHHQRQIYPSKDDSTIASVAATTSTSSTVISSVLSVSNPDGDDHHGDSDRNEDGDTTDDNDGDVAGDGLRGSDWVEKGGSTCHHLHYRPEPPYRGGWQARWPC